MYTVIRNASGGLVGITRDDYFDASDLEPGYTFKSGLSDDDFTGEELAIYLDDELEDANHHSMCGIAWELYTILSEVGVTDGVIAKTLHKLRRRWGV